MIVTISMSGVLDFTKNNFVKLLSFNFCNILLYYFELALGWWLVIELGFYDFAGSSVVFIVGAVISTVFSFLIIPKRSFLENGIVSKEIIGELTKSNNFISIFYYFRYDRLE